MAGGYHYSILQVGELDVQEPHRFSILPADCRQAAEQLEVWDSSLYRQTRSRPPSPYTHVILSYWSGLRRFEQ